MRSRDSASNIMRHIRLLSQLIIIITDRFFEDTLQDGYFDIILYLSVHEQEEANAVFKHFKTSLSARAGAELGSFSVCMFKLRVVFVRSGAGGGEGELGSVLLSVRRGSACAPNTARE